MISREKSNDWLYEYEALKAALMPGGRETEARMAGWLAGLQQRGEIRTHHRLNWANNVYTDGTRALTISNNARADQQAAT